MIVNIFNVLSLTWVLFSFHSSFPSFCDLCSCAIFFRVSCHKILLLFSSALSTLVWLHSPANWRAIRCRCGSQFFLCSSINTFCCNGLAALHDDITYDDNRIFIISFPSICWVLVTKQRKKNRNENRMRSQYAALLIDSISFYFTEPIQQGSSQKWTGSD